MNNFKSQASSVAEEDKRQFRILVDKLDDLEKKLRVVLAENDDTSASVVMVELEKH